MLVCDSVSPHEAAANRTSSWVNQSDHLAPMYSGSTLFNVVPLACSVLLSLCCLYRVQPIRMLGSNVWWVSVLCLCLVSSLLAVCMWLEIFPVYSAWGFPYCTGYTYLSVFVCDHCSDLSVWEFQWSWADNEWCCVSECHVVNTVCHSLYTAAAASCWCYC